MTSEQNDAVNQYFVHTELGWDFIRRRPKVHPAPPAANDDLQKYAVYVEEIQLLNNKLDVFKVELKQS
jgi:hypothetical protein